MPSGKIECNLLLKGSDFIMQNHHVYGVSVMPGVTFLDIVFRILAAKNWDHRRATIRNVIFPDLIATKENFDRKIRVTIGEQSAGVYELKAESQWVEAGLPRSQWQENFRGEITLTDGPEPPPVDIAALKAGATAHRRMDEVYAHAQSRGILHGSSMKCFGPIYETDDYLLAELRLDELSNAHLSDFYLHPAILDASTLLAFSRKGFTCAEPFIPMFIGSFHAQRQLTSPCYVHIPHVEVLAPSGDVMNNDYALYDVQGNRLGQFDKLTCKRIRFPGLITKLADEIDLPAGVAMAAPAAPSEPDPEICNAPDIAATVSNITQHLRDMIGKTLGKQPAEIRTDLGFYNLGLDSVAMLQMSRELEQLAGANLYPTLLFEFSDIDSLAHHLAEKYGSNFYQKSHQQAALPSQQSPPSDAALKAACYQAVWDSSPGPITPAEANPGDIVIFSAGGEINQEFERRLAAAGCRLIQVISGNEFESLSPNLYRLDFRSREQLALLLDDLSRRRALSNKFAFLAPPAGKDGKPSWDDVKDAFFSFWALASALIDRKPDQPCSLSFVFADQQGTPPPQYAAIGALARTIVKETPVLCCRSVRLDAWPDAGIIADIVLAESQHALQDCEVRYIEGIRHARRYASYDPAKQNSNIPLKERGVYLLAGGAGGLGSILAAHLAQRFKARLVLLGRSSITPAFEARMKQWESDGAQAHYLSADITCKPDVARVFAWVREKYGKLDGIFHCAGTLNDALFFRKQPADIEAVLSPKVMGALNLDEASNNDKLDFFVMFSSISATIANAGQCDYAFGNSFIEYFAEWRSQQNERSGKSLAVGWPLWADGGMRVTTEVRDRSKQTVGLWPMPTADGLNLLLRAMAGPESRVAVTYGEQAKIEKALHQAPIIKTQPASPSASSTSIKNSDTEIAISSPSVKDSDTEIAIIGLAGQYPQAPDLEAFWQNLAAGRDCIIEVPPDRWDHSQFFDADKHREGKTYSKWGGFLDGVELFDPAFFGISRKDAESMDPQERLFLKTCWKTIEDAGYAPSGLTEEVVGVFAGVMWNHYQLFPDGDAQSGVMPPALHAAVANRVSYSFNFSGPSMAVDTSCSSSLTAAHLAIESIKRGECSLALAGGVNVTIHPQKYLQLARGQFLSSDGRCRSFGEGGSGYVPGEGVGAILLKPLARARADGDHIYAVIKGSCLNHTGRSSGFTVPSPNSQAALIRDALKRAGIDPRTIGYIEAHGTGTALGDPIEMEGLRQAFSNAGLSLRSCAIGSVKSNIGHLESAAGIAGITKVLLEMQRKQLVPSLHAEHLNPHIDFENSPFYIQRELAHWPEPTQGVPRRAGVSAFGAGGANAHILLESYENESTPDLRQSPCLFLLSARDEITLQTYARSFIAFIDGHASDAEAFHSDDLKESLIRDAAELLGVSTESVDSREQLGDLGFDRISLSALVQRVGERCAIDPALLGLTLESTIEAIAEMRGDARMVAGESLSIADMTYTLQVGRPAMNTRLAIVSRDLAGVRSGLARFLTGDAPQRDEFWNVATETKITEATTPSMMPEELIALFQSNRLHELAEYWVSGIEIPWHLCYPRNGQYRSPRRVSLPSYPFREEPCWVGRWKANSRAAASEVTSPRRKISEAFKTPAQIATRPGQEVELRILDKGIALLAMRDRSNNNMFTEAMLQGLEASFAEIANRSDIKAVVVTGSDNVFSMGAPPQVLESIARKKSRFTDAAFLYEGLLRCDRPVIAAIQGHASGGGLIFGLYADMIVMSRESVYSANFIKYGFTPGMGATFILEDRLGRAVASEMFFTGRAVAGEELERRGSQIIFRPQAEVLPAALDLAYAIADKPLAAIKVLKNELANRVLHRLPEIIERESLMHDLVLGSESIERINEHFMKVDGFSRRPTQALSSASHEPDGGIEMAEHDRGSREDFVEPVTENLAALPGLKREEVFEAIEKAVCANLYLDGYEIDQKISFNEMGIDSIGVVEITRKLNQQFGLNLDSVAIYDHPTVPKLADFVLQVWAQTHAIRNAAMLPVPAAPRATQADPAPQQSTSASKASSLNKEAGRVVLKRLSTDSSSPAVDDKPKAQARITLKPAEDVEAKSKPVDKAVTRTRDSDAVTRTRDGDIAVIGMSCRFPDAADLQTFWANLAAGKDSIQEVPQERWDVARFFDSNRSAPDKTYSKWAGLLSDVDLFNASLFNISPMEAEFMDPQQRLFLENAWAGLEDAGYALNAGQKTRCGVFVGCNTGDYMHLLERAGQGGTGQAFLGNSASVLAARIAYFLNLSGPAVAIDTACSSSLVATHLACESIRSGECEMAVAGGVALMLTPRLHIWTSKMGMLSPTGRCATFDESADGIVLGEGVGVIVLKSLDKALKDRDQIYGVIRASGVNGDGKTNGLTAPSADSQAELLTMVYERAGIMPDEIGYIEAHGTGTSLGDPIEIKALKQAFREHTSRKEYCAIGSVKTNIGHTTMAAGVAGLIKVLLALKNRQLPPSLHFKNANPHIDFSDSPFYVVSRLSEWRPGPSGSRLAAVSSFGFSGTNCHMVVAEAPPPLAEQPATDPYFLLPISAETDVALARRLEQLAEWMKPEVSLCDLAYTLSVGRCHFPIRAALIARDMDDLKQKIDSLIKTGRAPHCFHHSTLKQVRRNNASDDLRKEFSPLLNNAGDVETFREELELLAESYASGCDPDWASFYKARPGRRICLPAYSFDRKRYWVDAPPAGLPAVSSSNGSVFTREIQPDNSLVAHHRVGKIPVLPAVASLLMAIDGAARCDFPMPIRLSRAQWLRQFEVTTPRLLRFSLKKEGDQLQFELAGDEKQPICYAHCAISRLHEGGLAEVIDLSSLIEKCPRHWLRDKIYTTFDQAGIHYGPSFKILDHIYFGRDEAIGRLIAPPASADDADGFTSQAALLDGALQTIAALESQTSSEPVVPFSLDSVELLGPIATSGFSIVTRRGDHRFNARLTDSQGRVFMRCEGFALRPRKDALDEMIFVPIWQSAAPARQPATRADGKQKVAVIYRRAAEPLAQALLALHADADAVRLLLEDDARSFSSLKSSFDIIYFLAAPDTLPMMPDYDHDTLALFRLVKALILTDQVRRPLTLKVVINGAVRISDDESIQPRCAGLIGLSRTIAAEYPGWSVTCIDIGAAATEPSSLARLLLLESSEHSLVALRGNGRFIRALEPIRLSASVDSNPFRPQGVYLILGGAGGIGFALSRHLAHTAHARLAWIGRSPMTDELEQKINEIEMLGGKAMYLQADATDLAAMRQAVARIREQFGSINGAFHAALVLRDMTLANMDEAVFNEALAPKVAGAIGFYESLREQALDFMLFFSSAASFVDARGQANYAAASAFEDAFALYLRKQCSFPVSVINWGYWGSVGVVADERYSQRFAAIGVGSIEPSEGIEAISRVLAHDIAQALVIKAGKHQMAKLGVGAGLGVTPVDVANVTKQYEGERHEGERHEGEQIWERSRSAFAQLERLSQNLLRGALMHMDGFPGPGSRMPVAHLEQRLGICEGQKRLFHALLHILDKTGFAQLNSDELVVFESAASTVDAADFISRFPEMMPHVRLLETCIEALPEILDGRRSHMEVLFPKGSLSAVEQVYKGHPGADYYNRLLADEVAAAAQSLADGSGRVIRLLEVGAGTGAATGFVLEACLLINPPIHYCYTDISQAFLRHGEQAFAKRFPSVSFRALNIEEAPAAQGFEAKGYDIILATNVLHATKSIERTLRHLQSLLRPGGLLFINEVTRTYDFLTLTFGLTPGWWAYEDGSQRLPHSPLLSPSQWQNALAQAGFQSVRAVGSPNTPVDDLEQCLLIAENKAMTIHEALSLQQPTHAYLKRAFAEVLKFRDSELSERMTFENFGVDSLVGMKIIDRLEQDLGDLPATLLFEHTTIERLANYLLAQRYDRLKALLQPRAAQPVRRVESNQHSSILSAPERPERPQASTDTQMDIAIVGVSGRYPRSPNLEAFWQNLAGAADCVTEIPADRWDWRVNFDSRRGQPHKSYNRWGGFIDDIDRFDPLFFNILPRDAENIDPQERLFLETCWELLEEAGYLGEHTREQKTGVFVGMMYGSYGMLGATAWARGQLAGAHSAYWSVANRVSYFFDFHGPSFAVDSACSSSLTAVHLACESIKRGECRMAIAGGVNLIMHPAHFAALCSMNMLSNDASCKVFDDRADGFVPGEGVGAVLLKPLDQAVADRDHIWGMIKCGLMNAGGKTGGYTVPNPNAQAELITDALRRGRVHPRTITYVEAHGTGTELGDPIEVASLTKAFREQESAHQYCAIGSVKANIGHLEGAAGMAGLTKVLLQMKHGQLAPCIHLSQTNSKIDFAASPFYPQQGLTEWPRPVLNLDGYERTYPRRAGVSSFGAGGANVHLVIEEYLDPARSPLSRLPETDEEYLFVFSARTRPQLNLLAGRMIEFLSGPEAQEISLSELAYSAQVGRREMIERLAILARTLAELTERMKNFVKDGSGPGIFAGAVGKDASARFLLEDQDGAAFINAMISKRQLAKLAQIWTSGVAIDWRLLWPDPKPRRAAFPTYPFEKKRYWLSLDESTDPNHYLPFASETKAVEPEPRATVKPEADWKQRYTECALEGDAFYLTEHRVAGDRWMPGVVFMELVRAQCAGHDVGDAFQMRDIIWPAPLNLEEGLRCVQVSLERDGRNIHFRITDPNTELNIFAQGMLSPAEESEAARLDIEAIRERCAHTRDASAFYEALGVAGLDYGPAFRVIETLRIGDGECLARLALPSSLESDFGNFVLHPALMDGALQTVAAICEGSISYLPIGISQMMMRERLMPRCWVHASEVELRTGAKGQRCFNLRVADDEGRVLVAIDSLTIAPNRAVPVATRCRYLRPVWEPASIISAPRQPRNALILTANDSLRDAIAGRLASSGTRCVFAAPGLEFGSQGNASYKLASGEREHYQRMVDELIRQDRLPDTILHFWSHESLNADPALLSAQIDEGFYSVLFLATAVLAHKSESPLRLVFAHATQADGPQPQYAAVGGALKTLAMEHTRFSGARVAFEGCDASALGEEVAARLAEELLSDEDGVFEITYRDGERYRKQLQVFEPARIGEKNDLPLRAGGTYLITGGAGILGLRFAAFLVERGPINLVLAGRSRLDAQLQARIDSLSSGNAAVSYYQADLQNLAEVRDLITHIKSRYGALRGIIHAAGINLDALAVRKQRTEMKAVLGPKVFGTVYLDEATRFEPLDFFVLFSSVVAETGNLGQADYAFANAFLNEFAQLREVRRQAGLRAGKTLSIGWPLWRESGMAVNAATRRLFARKWAMVPMRTQTGLRAFCQGLAGPDTCIMVVEGPEQDKADEQKAPLSYPAADPSPLIDYLPLVHRDLRIIASRFLLVDEREIELQTDLMEMGFDSVSLTELINQVNEDYGLDLLPTILFECLDLASFARYLHANHQTALAIRYADNARNASMPEPTANSTADVDRASVNAADEIQKLEPHARPALRSRKPAPTPALDNAIAIIGMSAMMPQSEDLDAFWSHLAAGDDLIVPIPDDRESLRRHPVTRDARGGFLKHVDKFDALFFGISPQEASLMDPQQRLFLETVWHTIEDAGYKPSDFAGSATGLFVGVGTSDYDDLLREHGVEVEAHTATGIAHSILANRVSYLLDLRGPSEAVDTACSSSLVAIHRSIKAISCGECETAIAGGVNVILSPGLFTAFAKSGMLSRDGKCKTFDKDADGYVRGEGSGAVLLKRLDRAIADGDHIYAVIKGSAVNHGGRATSLTAPNPESQARVLLQAYREANIDPDTLTYIEAHGTGTKLGDPIEIEGMKKAFAELYQERKKPLPEKPHIAIGSVKSNIGHLEAAAGIAGVLKVLLSMKHGELPANLHFKEINPYLRLERTPFYINHLKRKWDGIIDEDGRIVRRAGVSSFGFGGSNAHLVLEAYQPPLAPARPRSTAPQLVILSAPNNEALAAYALRLARFLKNNQDTDLAGLAYTLQFGREQLAARLAVITSDKDHLIETLSAAAQEIDEVACLHGRASRAGSSASLGDSELERLAQLWINGADVEWNKLWPGQKPLRVSLPGFPLARVRHWFDMRASKPKLEAAPPGPAKENGRKSLAHRNGRGPKVKLTTPGASIAAHSSTAPHSSTTPVMAAVTSKEASAPRDSVAETVRERLSELLAIPVSEIGDERPFMELGLDSIYCMDLVRLLNSAFSINLQATTLYDYKTIGTLARHVNSLLAGRNGHSSVDALKDSHHGIEVLPTKTDRDCSPAQVEGLLGQLICKLLGRGLDASRSFSENGLTSFDMLKIVNALEKRFGALRKTLLFDRPTLAELASHLYDLHGPNLMKHLDAAPTEFDAQESIVASIAASTLKSDTATASLHKDGGPVIARKSNLSDQPEVEMAIRAIDRRYGKEGGLAGRDIAPFVFLGSARKGYFNFSKHEDVILAFSYAGPVDYLSELTSELVSHARQNRLKPNILSLTRMVDVAGAAFTATPFGAVQRLELNQFGLKGNRMRRLRYMIQNFERSGVCRTIEYRSGSDSAIDSQIACLVDQWCETKQMVNPYVSNIRDEICFGLLKPNHRMFLTYLNDTLSNAVIVTRILSENGYLLDMEFYSKDMPLGGLEFTIAHIIDRLIAEGHTHFSFGASFGVKICESPNADPEADRALDELRSLGIFSGEGNFRFKNKFRPENLPIYLCRPASADNADVSDIILMIANPSVSPKFDSANPTPTDAPTETQTRREHLLAAHGYNPVNIPAQHIEYDLLTDSWAELEGAFIAERMRTLNARLAEQSPAADLALQTALPFAFVLPTASGRSAEALLCRAWPKRNAVVIQNSLFPTWTFNQIDNGFTPVALNPIRDFDLRSDALFKGNLNLAELEGLLSEGAHRVAFVCVEVSNNAIGGYPISLANLKEVKRLAMSHEVPLVLDATRILENAFFIADHEEGCQGRDVWDIARDMLLLADSVTISLSKDFCANLGGVVATNDPAVAQNLREQVEARGLDVNITNRKIIALTLDDRDYAASHVRQRMNCVKALWQSLAESGVPVIRPASGHSVLIDVARIPQFARNLYARPSCLAWIYRNTGIRVAPHLNGIHKDTALNNCVRLALPVGMTMADTKIIAARLVSLFDAPVEAPDLIAVGTPTGPIQEAQATYHPADRVPQDIYECLREGYRPKDQNFQMLREHAETVERQIIRIADGDVEVFVAGEGEPLLLMHGFNIGAGQFAHQFSKLTDRYKLIVIHHPGVGATTAAHDLSLHGIAGLFMEVLSRLDIAGPIHVAGTSFGGLVAQAFALRYPRRTASLTLICSSYKVGNRAGQVNRLGHVVESDFDHLISHTGSQRLKQNRNYYETFLLRCESMDPQTGLRYLDEFAQSHDLLASLPEIAVPTLIIQSRYDSVISSETARLLRQTIPNALYEEIADAGHFPFLTNADEINRIMSDFMARQLAAAIDGDASLETKNA